MAAPVTYQLDGRQYVSILAGWGGAQALVLGANPAGSYKPPGRLWTFALDGSQPVVPVKGQPRPVLSAVNVAATPAQIKQGMQLYTENCMVCHGVAAVGGGIIADLRYSAPAVLRSYRNIVLEGSHLSMGMPSFAGILTAGEVEAINSFVLSQRARLTKPAGGR